MYNCIILPSRLKHSLQCSTQFAKRSREWNIGSKWWPTAPPRGLLSFYVHHSFLHQRTCSSILHLVGKCGEVMQRSRRLRNTAAVTMVLKSLINSGDYIVIVTPQLRLVSVTPLLSTQHMGGVRRVVAVTQWSENKTITIKTRPSRWRTPSGEHLHGPACELIRYAVNLPVTYLPITTQGIR